MASGPAPTTSNCPCSMSDDRHGTNVRNTPVVPARGVPPQMAGLRFMVNRSLRPDSRVAGFDLASGLFRPVPCARWLEFRRKREARTIWCPRTWRSAPTRRASPKNRENNPMQRKELACFDPLVAEFDVENRSGKRVPVMIPVKLRGLAKPPKFRI
jgi:hypothetical protein